MKKLLAMLLALAMMLGCVAVGEGVDYTGAWVLTGLEMGDIMMDMTILAQMGMDMTMTVNADGTMFTTTMGVTENGTWVVTEKGIAITDDEETVELVYANDMLRIEEDGAAMLLTREGAEPAVAEEIVPTVPVEEFDFTGYWVMTAAEMAGMSFDPYALGLNAYMELYEDGNCLLVMMDEMQYGVWGVTETGIASVDEAGVVDSYTLVGDQLVIEQEGMKLVFTKEAYTMPLGGLTLADFEGDWVFEYVEVGNESYYADEVGIYMTLSIQDGKGVHTMTFADESGETTEINNGVCELEEIPDWGTAMYLIYTDEAGQQDGGIMLLKFDNSELVWYAVDENDINLFYCFVPQALLEE